MNAIYIAVSILALAVLWWWFIGRNRPVYPPIDIADDDPLIIEASDRARQTLDHFFRMVADGAEDAQVKVPFASNSGATEYLWAAVLEVAEEKVKVRYLTPPATHRGKVERVHIVPISELRDWAVFDEEGRIHGGYTQRVMFTRAREAWGELPRELEEQEKRYVT